MAAIIDYRGKSPTKTTYGVPLITAKIVKDGRIFPPEEYINDEAYAGWMRRGFPEPGDIVMTTEAPLGEVARLDSRKVALAQRLITLRGKADVVDNLYLKYAMQGEFVQNQLKARATGTTVLGIRQSELRKVLLPVPPLGEQRELGNILGALDDKIEFNRKMNETLEAVARAIFKSWFVDFDPVRAESEGRQPFGMDAETAALFPDSFQDSPLGKIPKGWRFGKVRELVSLHRDGLNPGDFPEEVFHHYSVPAFDEGRCPKLEKGEEIKSNKFTVPEGAVMLSKLNPRIPRVWLPSIGNSPRAVASTEFLIVLPNPGFSREFLYALLSSDNFLVDFAMLVTGTSGSHQRVKPESLLNMDVVIPGQTAVGVYTRLAECFFQRASVAREESIALAAIRDALLPKLISGQIRVKDIETSAEAGPRRAG